MNYAIDPTKYTRMDPRRNRPLPGPPRPSRAANATGAAFRLAKATMKGEKVRATIIAEAWPMVLLPLKLLAKPNDRGAGDIIARTIGPIGGEAFKKWYKTLFGRDCGCGNRQESLNARWPL